MHFAEDDLPESVAELRAQHGVPADRLILESTEGAFVPEPERAAAILLRLDDLGGQRLGRRFRHRVVIHVAADADEAAQVCRRGRSRRWRPGGAAPVGSNR